MIFQHFLHVIGINDEILLLLIVVLWDSERGIDIDLSAINRAKESSHHNISLILGLSEVMVDDIGGNSWVNETVEGFHCQTEVQIWKF